MGHFIIGTAGHIDHGKTALVRALTGIDTDRLKEEKERGITIDLGFAYWQDGITIIDVPGHERFIRNMVAGVSAIDFVLLVIAADDGIMPQTEEHLEILKLLQISAGSVVITKIDLAEEMRLDKLESEIRAFLSDSFLKDAPVFRVSAAQNTGIDILSLHLQDAAKKSVPKNDRGLFRMNIDRSFSVKGFGTVLTGTLLSGTVHNGQSAELLPQRKMVRIRGLQKHSHSVEEVRIGDRAAINVTGIDKETTKRGNVLAEPNHLTSTTSFLAKVYMLKSVRKALDKSIRVRLHIGTAELFGNLQVVGQALQAGNAGYIRMVTEDPLVCIHGDRFIVREINSSSTLGGGIVLDHHESDAKPDVDYLHDMTDSDLSNTLGRFVGFHKIVTVKDIIAVFGYSFPIIENELVKLEQLKQIAILGAQQHIIIDGNYYAVLEADLLNTITLFHRKQPAEKGIKRSELRMRFAVTVHDDVFYSVLRKMIDNRLLCEEKEIVSLSSYRIQLNAEDRKLIGEIEQRLLQNLFSPPSAETIALEMSLSLQNFRRLTRVMVQLEMAVKTEENLYFHADAVREARQFVIDFITKKGHIKITDFKDWFHISRKFALSILEYFDVIQVTSRNGDSRVLFHA